MLKEKGKVSQQQPAKPYTREYLTPQSLFDYVTVKIALPREEPRILVQPTRPPPSHDHEMKDTATDKTTAREERKKKGQREKHRDNQANQHHAPSQEGTHDTIMVNSSQNEQSHTESDLRGSGKVSVQKQQVQQEQP